LNVPFSAYSSSCTMVRPPETVLTFAFFFSRSRRALFLVTLSASLPVRLRRVVVTISVIAEEGLSSAMVGSLRKRGKISHWMRSEKPLPVLLVGIARSWPLPGMLSPVNQTPTNLPYALPRLSPGHRLPVSPARTANSQPASWNVNRDRHKPHAGKHLPCPSPLHLARKRP